MARQQRELEERLDQMLTRIAKETEDIRDLEQQLTEGQIAANDALKRDLEGIIAGLQQYLSGVQDRARQAGEACGRLQQENEELQRRLAQLQQDKQELEVVAEDADVMRKEVLELERLLQEQQEANASLQGEQGERDAQLQAQLDEMEIEHQQLQDQLRAQHQRSKGEQAALLAELQREKEALEAAIEQAGQARAHEQENQRLLQQLRALQASPAMLSRRLQDAEAQAERTARETVRRDEVAAHLTQLREEVEGPRGPLDEEEEG
ncbi:centriolin-like [Lethenteron reissneri]|uniref:centriolin-like n=1 Tax=Lethenteron reissneri TaxID=7753 RepID=UPI002AB68BCA|nr:centriolin-like [Lethenteron reissneri]